MCLPPKRGDQRWRDPFRRTAEHAEASLHFAFNSSECGTLQPVHFLLSFLTLFAILQTSFAGSEVLRREEVRKVFSR